MSTISCLRTIDAHPITDSGTEAGDSLVAAYPAENLTKLYGRLCGQ